MPIFHGGSLVFYDRSADLPLTPHWTMMSRRASCAENGIEHGGGACTRVAWLETPRIIEPTATVCTFVGGRAYNLHVSFQPVSHWDVLYPRVGTWSPVMSSHTVVERTCTPRPCIITVVNAGCEGLKCRE